MRNPWPLFGAPLYSLPSPGPYSYCNTTLDQIGTCWPQSVAGALVERPCPEYFNGIKYNTTRECPLILAYGLYAGPQEGCLGVGVG